VELELLEKRPARTKGEVAPAAGAGAEQVRSDLDGILAEADRILDGLRPINAEAYLQQNRQRGGQ
jgi:hypothetical protein